jgi:hypothetical protein
MYNLLNHIFNCTKETIVVDEFTNFFANTSQQQQVECFTKFWQENDDAWIDDYEMDLNKCRNPFISIENKSIDLRPLLNDFMSKIQRIQFWKFMSNAVGRSVEKLVEHRMEALNNAVLLFSENLRKVGVNISHQELCSFISNNKSAIENRYLNCLEPKLPIEFKQGDDVIFWEHMENIYNIMHPYAPIKKNIASELVSNIVSSITQSTSADSNPMDSIQNILNPNILNQMASVMQAPGGLNNLLSSLMSVIGGTSDAGGLQDLMSSLVQK